ncbi:MAG: hypothetical protein J7L15_01970 [Clostridiales bacterium]|nr:hypothetical protein [Clostridiales bacterium]
MSNIQAIIENVTESKFYLVEHVFENAITHFCKVATNDQIELVDKYVGLIKEGKMSKVLETQLSEELTPYLEEYVNIYTPYLFSDINESESKFEFSSYRNKVGSDVVLELFGKIGQKVATIGAVIASAAVATWAIKDSDGLQKAIDTIVEKTKESPEKVRTFVESMFTEEKNPDDIVDKIVKLSTQTGNAIGSAIKNTSETISSTASKVWKSFVGLVKKSMEDPSKYKITTI